MKLKADVAIIDIIGHLLMWVILWMIISVITLGLGFIFYFYRVWNYALNNTSAE